MPMVHLSGREAKMSPSYVHVFLVVISVAARCVHTETVVVSTALGTVVGTIEKTFNGESVEIFRGIPYARPPVGELRFAHPQSYGPVGNGFNATKFGNVCHIPPNFDYMLVGAPPKSEDCLSLNIYRPENTKAGSRLPVLAVIHGGGFTIGHSAELWLRGEPLSALGDMVVVAFNYRLGVFGFADMGELAPGNLGLFDQKLALEWIQEHIGHFGGDPNKVTLMGVSAGSMSVFAHIISPLTRDKNLFQAAIMDAGVLAEGFITPPEKMHERVRVVAAAVNCPIEGTAMLQCLRSTDAADLAKHSFDPEYSFLLTFFPTLDGDYLPKSLLPDLRDNISKYMNIPIIIGYAENEGSMFVRNSLGSTQGDPDVQSEESFVQWCKVLSNSFKYPFDFNNESTRKNLLELYYEPYDDKLQGASDLIADETFICPVNAFLTEYSKHNHQIYMYKFSRVMKRNYGFDPEVLGAFHFSPFLHFMGAFLPLGDKVDADDKKFFIDSALLLADFVHGKPLILREVTWPNFSKNGQLLEIKDQGPSVLNDLPHGDNCHKMHDRYTIPAGRK